MDRYSVVFCGTPEFACPSLLALHNNPQFRITQVITQPDRPVGRKQEIMPPPVKKLAHSLGIDVLQPENINSLISAGSSKLATPDFLVVVAYGQILSKELLAWPKRAAVNLHASLLPLLRGASPIQHAILHGEGETGITLQRMSEKLDSGPILAQKKIVINPRETAETLSQKLAVIGALLLQETLVQPLKEYPQDESAATYCGKLSKSMSMVDPEQMTAAEIDRRVRALSPWPGVRIVLSGKEIIVMNASIDPDPNAFPLFCAKQSTLYIALLKSAGGTAITGKEWMGQNHKK